MVDKRTLVLGILGALVAWLQGGWEVAAIVIGGAMTWLAWRAREGPAAELDRERSSALLLALAPAAAPSVLSSVFLIHLFVGSILFGGGYVLVALLQPYAVGQFHWLTSAQMLDGVAITQAIPGPISTLTAFVGYAAAGVPGAALATTGLYLPSFAAVLAVAPHMPRLREAPAVKAALLGVSAVVAGAILGVAASLSRAAVQAPIAAVVFGAALLAVARWGVAGGWVVLGGLLCGLARTFAL
jgi:chromate transporter